MILLDGTAPLSKWMQIVRIQDPPYVLICTYLNTTQLYNTTAIPYLVETGPHPRPDCSQETVILPIDKRLPGRPFESAGLHTRDVEDMAVDQY